MIWKMGWKMIIAAIVAGLLSACGVGKSATSTSGAGGADGQEQPGLTKAEIDTLQHEAARLAMEQGEFVFMITRITENGKGGNTSPVTNYMEVTDGKFFFQGSRYSNRPQRRTAGKITDVKIMEESKSTKMFIKIASGSMSVFTDVSITLYPGTNRSFATLYGSARLDIEGYIVPRRFAKVSRSVWSSPAERYGIL